MAKGLMKLVGANKGAVSEVLQLPTETEVVAKPLGMKVDNWIELALETHYVDARPTWGAPRRLDQGFTPSSLGEPNDRLLVASLLGYRGEPIGERLQRIFDAGNDIEARWMVRFKNIGVLLAPKHEKDGQVWLPNSAGSPLFFRGKIDALVEHKFESGRRFIVEIKSINPELYRQLPRLSLDPQVNYTALMGLQGALRDRIHKYMHQLQVYLREMQMDEGMLLFDNKGTQEFLPFHVPRQDEFVDKIYERLVWLRDEYWSQRVLPPWNGPKGKSFFATYKPTEAVAIDEIKQAFGGETVEEEEPAF